MPAFDIPTVPAISQRSPAYHVPKEDAHRAKRHVTAPRKGSMTYDRKKGGMTKDWANEEDLQSWLAAEESDNSIELIVSYIMRSDSPDWREWCVLRCSREFMGGKKNYQNKHAWDRKIPSKTTGCPCTLTLKRYPETETILSKYKDQHNHTLSNDNLRFTRLSGKARNIVMDMFYTGIKSKSIVRHNDVIHCRADNHCLAETRAGVQKADGSRSLYYSP